MRTNLPLKWMGFTLTLICCHCAMEVNKSDVNKIYDNDESNKI